jgi:hypothetical protein
MRGESDLVDIIEANMDDGMDENKVHDDSKEECRPKYRSKKWKYKRKERNLPDRQYIEDMCYREGLLGNNVFDTCYSMLKEFRKKRYNDPNDVPKSYTNEQITESKLSVRRDFLEAVTVPMEESEGEQDRIIRDVVKFPWLDDKLEIIKNHMKEYPQWGGLYIDILDNCYFHPIVEKDEVTGQNKEMYVIMNMSKSRFYDRHKEAVMLLGIELWRYAKRREIEDMENGIIPWHDIYPDRPGDEIPDRRRHPRDED